jgi:mono/diheme cytochrome c family protein
MAKFERRAIRSLVAAACFALFAATAESAAAQDYGTMDIQAGYKLYAAQCALCHGGNGDAEAGISLARQQFRRASTDADIKSTITTGVASAGMPSFQFQPGELNGLVAYIRSGFDLAGAAFKVGNAAREGYFYALDAKTGKELRKTNLGALSSWRRSHIRSMANNMCPSFPGTIWSRLRFVTRLAKRTGGAVI